MGPEQWRRVRELFERALDEAPPDVREWLAREAADDAAVAAEAASLLVNHGMASAFLLQPIVERMPELLAEDRAMDSGAIVGPYTIVREIGRGGMGRVYLATDSRLGRTVALKALPPAFARDHSQRERLRREAQAAASLAHPGICTIYALEEIDGELFMATEFVDGRTLREEIASGATPSADELERTASELAAALATAHARGLTHRDFKPENVMRARDGRLKILDFGLALTVRAPAAGQPPRVTLPGAFVGTPAYMAPEQLNGGPASPRSDVFAFGVVLYEYASGHHPFSANTALALAGRVLASDPRPIENVRPDVPPQLAAIIERCLRKEPEDRFTSASDIVSALERGAAPSSVRGVTPWWRRHQVTVVVLYAIACALAWQNKEWLHGFAEPLFLLIGVSATVASVFRGHLIFTERMNRASLHAERRRARSVTLGVDLIIALALTVDGLMVARQRPLMAVLTIGLGAGLALARIVVEPATTRAAFGGANPMSVER